MPEISFAWTTPALLAGAKTVTRREWSDQYVRQFSDGQRVTALNRQRRFRGEPVAVIRLTGEPYKENSMNAPPEDYALEGFHFLERAGAKVDKLTPPVLWRAWHRTGTAHDFYVVRFEVVEYLVAHVHWCRACASLWDHEADGCRVMDLEHEAGTCATAPKLF